MCDLQYLDYKPGVKTKLYLDYKPGVKPKLYLDYKPMSSRKSRVESPVCDRQYLDCKPSVKTKLYLEYKPLFVWNKVVFSAKKTSKISP